MKKTTYIIISILCAIAAVAVHSYLTNEYYNFHLGLNFEKSVCNINATFNCDVVTASRYSSLFGIPMALFGAVTNAVLLLLLLIQLTGFSDHPERVGRYATWLNLLIAATSIVMGSISTFMIGTYCLFCMSAYALSFISAFTTWKYQSTNVFADLAGDIQALFKESKSILIILALIPIGSFIGNKIVLDAKGYDAIQRMIGSSMSEWPNNPVVAFSDVGLTLKNPSNQETRMTIVELADFGCPHCRVAAPMLHAFIENHPGTKLIFKVFPLDGTCNPVIERKGDGIRCEIAKAVFCSEKLKQQGWTAQAWAFDNQEKVFSHATADEGVKAISEQTGIAIDELKTCMQSQEITDQITAMANEGKLANINGTPSVFVNGKSVSYGQTLPVLQAIYNSLN